MTQRTNEGSLGHTDAPSSAVAPTRRLPTPALRPRVFITGVIPDRVRDLLHREFEVLDRPDGAEGVLATITTTIDDAFLESVGPQLRIVANYGVGVDNIDLAAAVRRKVSVTNTPDVLTNATAELTLALILVLLRRVAEGDRLIRRRERWQFSLVFMLGEGLEGKTVGILGPGRIGQRVARLAEAFGATTLFCGRGEPLVPFLGQSDIVSVHCPLTPESRHLIDLEAFAHMRRTAILVNTARGPIVKEDDLVAALEQKLIAGAALDVFEFEPRVSEALLRFENVVLTPHIGSGTRSTRDAMGLVAIDALRSVLLQGSRPATAVCG